MSASAEKPITPVAKRCRTSAQALLQLSGFTHQPRFSRSPNPCGNLLIQGENLATLTALLPKYGSSVRCCYIDPPYNNRERHYHFHDA